jgi:hypothetical protein
MVAVSPGRLSSFRVICQTDNQKVTYTYFLKPSGNIKVYQPHRFFPEFNHFGKKIADDLKKAAEIFL